MKIDQVQRAKQIERAIRITLESLVSHLDGTHTLSSTRKEYKEEVGDCKFHQNCVREYAEVVQILSNLY